MGILIHASLRKRVIDVVCDWRSIRVDLLADSRDGCHHPSRSFLFSHLAHELFQDSLNVAIALGKLRPRGSILSWLGDMNADQGNGDHKFDLFLNGCKDLKLGWCPLKFMEVGMPFTRRPDGEQALSQVPSVIDHVALERKDSQADSFARWAGTPGDHALIGTDVLGFSRKSKRRRPMKWVPSNIFEVSNEADRILPRYSELIRVDELQRPDSCCIIHHDPVDIFSTFEFWGTVLGDLHQATQAPPAR